MFREDASHATSILCCPPARTRRSCLVNNEPKSDGNHSTAEQTHHPPKLRHGAPAASHVPAASFSTWLAAWPEPSARRGAQRAHCGDHWASRATLPGFSHCPVKAARCDDTERHGSRSTVIVATPGFSYSTNRENPPPTRV